MRIVDHVYANTLILIVKDLMSQVEYDEDFVNDVRTKEEKEESREDSSKRVKLITPALINLNRCFKWGIDEDMKAFIKRHNIQMPEGDGKELRETYAGIFKKWVGEADFVSKEEFEISEDFCTYLDSHFDEELIGLFSKLQPEPDEQKEYIHNMAACMLSILDYLKLQDNCKHLSDDMLKLNDETLSQMM